MADTPEAAAPVPTTGETVATPTNTNTEPAKAPESNPVDLHGFTQEDLAGMRTFIDNNGGWDKIKSRISNPEKPAEKSVEPQITEEKKEEPTSHTQEPEQKFQTPKGAITAQEFLAKQYFQALAGEEKYAPISKGIANGDYLKEMAAFGINAMNPDGSINDQKVRMYLDLKAQTVPAKPTNSEPNASVSPTVDYVNVGDEIDIDYEINFSEITPELLGYLKLFNPFGPWNQKPIFVTRNVYDYSTSKLVGKNQEHIKLELVDSKSDKVINGIAFNMSEHFDYIKSGKPFDICYTIEENKHKTNGSIQLQIKYIRFSEEQ